MAALASFRNRLADVIRGSARPGRHARVQPEPIPFHSAQRFTGIGITNQPDADLLLREARGWSAIATSAIADRVASLIPAVYRMRDDGTEEVLGPLHPLSRTLAGSRANVHSPMIRQRLVAQYLVTIGEAYLLKVRGRALRVPVELWVMPAPRVRPVLTRGAVTGYIVQNGDGAEREIPAEDVVRIFRADPESLYSAEGVLGPQGVVADSQKFADQTMREHFEHNAMPRAVIESADGATPSLEPEEVERLNEFWRQRFNRRLGSQRGLPAWLPSGFQVHELAALGGVQDLTPVLAAWRDQILAAYGVPKSVLGLTDEAGLGRATAETNDYVFAAHTIKPLADLIGEALTLQLAVPDFGDGLRIGFQEFVPRDKDFELRRDETELRAKLRPVNEIRKRAGDDPVPWGDWPVGTIGEAPYTGEELEPLGPDDPAALDQGEDEDGRSRAPRAPRAAARARARIDVEVEWQRAVARERKWTPAFERGMRAVLAVQEREMRRVIRALFGDGRALERAEPSALEVAAAIEKTLAGSRWSKLFTEKLEKVRLASYVGTATDSLRLVGVTAAFELKPETAARLRANAAEFRRLVSNTSIKRVARAVSEELAKGVEAGEALATRAKRVEDAVGRAFLTRRNEARTIARTETLKTTQAAQIDGFETSGVVEGKRWNTSRDDAVRDSHELDGQEVELHEPFTLPADPARKMGEELADAPGVGANGATLSAGNTTNCRCFVTPVLEEK